MSISQLEKVAMPEEVVLVLDEQLRIAPPAGGVMVSVTEVLLAVLVLPPASWMATMGCKAKPVLTAVSDGERVKPSLTAGPTEIVRLELTALLSPLETAVSVYVPALSMAQPSKLATPATASTGFSVQVSTAPAGVVILRFTEAVLAVTVLPPASWTVTTGWVGKGMPPVELEGLVVKASLVAGPTEIVKLALAALVSPVAVAVRV